jgi:hypothetical protein
MLLRRGKLLLTAILVYAKANELRMTNQGSIAEKYFGLFRSVVLFRNLL